MTPQELRDRTKRFAVDVIRFCRTLPRTDEGRIVAGQLLRAGTGVGANYRASCRPRSDKDFIAKLGIAIEEADESAFWFEVIVAAAIASQAAVLRLERECDELIRILVSSRETARRTARERARKRKRALITNHKSPITNA